MKRVVIPLPKGDSYETSEQLIVEAVSSNTCGISLMLYNQHCTSAQKRPTDWGEKR